MKAMVLTGLNRMEMRDLPDPVLSADTEVLIRMGAIGVCGSDIHYYREGSIGKQVVHYPYRVGHEGAGTVVETGSRVTRVRPGDRVAIDPAISCGHCDQCLAGRSHTCRTLAFLGCPGQAEGCLSELLVMPEKCLYPIPGNMSLEVAALTEPLSIGLYAVDISIPMEGATAGILGSGPIGISVLLSAITLGAHRVYVTDKIGERLGLASRMGAYLTANPDLSDVVTLILDEEPLMLDVVFECCGQQEAMDQAVELLKPGGKLMIVGIPSFAHWSFPVDVLRHKEISIQNVRRQVDRVEKTLRMISGGMLDPAPMITHRFPFEEAADAFDLVASYRDGVMKAMIHF